MVEKQNQMLKSAEEEDQRSRTIVSQNDSEDSDTESDSLCKTGIIGWRIANYLIIL